MSIIIKREAASYVLIVRLPKLGVSLVGMLRVASQQSAWCLVENWPRCLLGHRCGYVRLFFMIKGILSFNSLESGAQYPDIVFFSVIRVKDKEIYLLHHPPPNPPK